MEMAQRRRLLASGIAALAAVGGLVGGCRREAATAVVPDAGPTPAASTAPTTHDVLALGAVSAPQALSPDGRWLAFFRPTRRPPDGEKSTGECDRVVFYEVATSARWEIDAGRRRQDTMDDALALEWADDSAACWIAAGGGCSVEPGTLSGGHPLVQPSHRTDSPRCSIRASPV